MNKLVVDLSSGEAVEEIRPLSDAELAQRDQDEAAHQDHLKTVQLEQERRAHLANLAYLVEQGLASEAHALELLAGCARLLLG